MGQILGTDIKLIIQEKRKELGEGAKDISGNTVMKPDTGGSIKIQDEHGTDQFNATLNGIQLKDGVVVNNIKDVLFLTDATDSNSLATAKAIINYIAQHSAGLLKHYTKADRAELINTSYTVSDSPAVIFVQDYRTTEEITNGDSAYWAFVYFDLENDTPLYSDLASQKDEVSLGTALQIQDTLNSGGLYLLDTTAKNKVSNIPANTAGDITTNTQEIDALKARVQLLESNNSVDELLPLGTMIFSGANEGIMSSKWAKCDGRNIVGSAWNLLSGQANVPDLRGAFIRTMDDGKGVDTWVNRPLYSLQYDAVKEHQHYVNLATPVKGAGPQWLPHGEYYNTYNHVNMITTGNSSASSAENLVRNVSMWAYMKIN